ncbi:hypothetical protein CH063_15794, partial [Colletotrichum higginsianum]
TPRSPACGTASKRFRPPKFVSSVDTTKEKADGETRRRERRFFAKSPGAVLWEEELSWLYVSKGGGAFCGLAGEKPGPEKETEIHQAHWGRFREGGASFSFVCGCACGWSVCALGVYICGGSIGRRPPMDCRLQVLLLFYLGSSAPSAPGFGGVSKNRDLCFEFALMVLFNHQVERLRLDNRA